MAIALEYPALRIKFYLEADPAADKEKPAAINPVFVDFLAKQGGWCFLPEHTEINPNSIEGVVWCQGHLAFYDHRRQFAREIPAKTLFFQPPPEKIRICTHKGSSLRYYGRGPAEVPYSATDQTLKGTVYAILDAMYERGFDELPAHLKRIFGLRDYGSKQHEDCHHALCLPLNAWCVPKSEEQVLCG